MYFSVETPGYFGRSSFGKWEWEFTRPGAKAPILTTGVRTAHNSITSTNRTQSSTRAIMATMHASKIELPNLSTRKNAL